ncbi:hypothetical protein EXU85_06940 [Spirosoma sp. KCTC 42546]|uniref:three component ABC system middle component n=1 Tax=Spirosoma sp. KCTC 42546 TaxID=2520506 RepID=UPI00115BCCE5|nr:three component ABC system middle component [Spirosoma sp. KCTC 42546]QDK78350.1 hypothetical protein EXU85_06940 [Spirosoma sp. KCTC 42546]
MLPTWNDRPVTVAHLLNPAFCGEILRRCSESYKKNHIDKKSLPFALCFVVLPLVLHLSIRTALPKKSNRRLVDWVEDNKYLVLKLPGLIRMLIPYTKEAIMFLMIYDVVIINTVGEIEVIKKSPKYKVPEAIETLECFSKAEIIGSWFAKSGSFQSIFIIFGIRP